MTGIAKKSIYLGALLLCGFAVIFVYASGAISKEADKPYKATTVEECIQEKECVWYAFSRQLGLDDYVRWMINGKSLKKWDEPMGFRATANGPVKPSDYLPELTEQVVKPLEKYLPFKIQPGGRYVVFFADNIQETIDEAAEDFKKIQIETQRSKSQYNKDHGGNEGCYTTLMTEKGRTGITRAVTFVDSKSDKAPYCTATHFYHALGFWGHLKGQPFSFLADGNSPVELTKLDKFLVFLLYQPEFKNGQNAKQIKRVFDQIFPSKQQQFLSVD